MAWNERPVATVLRLGVVASIWLSGFVYRPVGQKELAER